MKTIGRTVIKGSQWPCWSRNSIDVDNLNICQITRNRLFDIVSTITRHTLYYTVDVTTIEHKYTQVSRESIIAISITLEDNGMME